MPPFVLVVGAGQAGLATGYYLRKAGLPFLIVDAAERVGDSWRNRYASLRLFTPRQFSALPGVTLTGNREQYATRDEFADYLESYASRFALPLRLQSRVTRLVQGDQGRFEAVLEDDERILATHLVIASGGFQEPIRPGLADSFGLNVIQLTAGTYRDPSQVPVGTALVVGDGASGRDIAVELAAAGRATVLAVGKPRKLFPERLLGKSIWWWLNWVGLLRASPTSLIGQVMHRTDAFPDRDRNMDSLGHKGIQIAPRLSAASGTVGTFADGSTADVATVVWAVGYRDDTTWVDIEAAKGPGGVFLHDQGVSPVPGLFFVGRPWQRNRASALIMGAGPDAAEIVKRIASSSRP